MIKAIGVYISPVMVKQKTYILTLWAKNFFKIRIIDLIQII